MNDRDEYKAVFGELRRRLKAADQPGGLAAPGSRDALAAALADAGELIRRAMLRRRTDSRATGSLRPGRIYLEEIDERRVRRAAELLGVEPPLLPPQSAPPA